MAVKIDVTEKAFTPERMLCVDADGVHIYSDHTDYYVRAYDKNFSTVSTSAVASGHVIQRIFSTKIPGLIFVSGVSGQAPNNLYKLFRSADWGATWTEVLQIGFSNIDGHVGGVSTLDHSICDLNGVLYFGEYNVAQSRIPGSTYDKVTIYQSTDLGITWASIMEWNTNNTNQIRHVHAMLEYRGFIYVCLGDSGNQAGIIRWDPSIGVWENNLTLPSFTDRPGFNVVYGSQRYRAVHILFKGDYGYLMSDNDTVDMDNKGIFRFKLDFSEYERVNSDIVNFVGHVGWGGIISENGTLFLADSLQSTATDSNINIWSSTDGIDWKIVGKFGCNLTANTLNFMNFNKQLVINNNLSRSSGKGGISTVFVSEQGDYKMGDIPTIIHPVYFIDPMGIDNITVGRGWTPNMPYQTLSYALLNNRITPGARIKLSEGSYNHAAVIPVFNANAFPGTGPVLIEGAGSEKTIVSKGLDTSGTYLVYHTITGGDCIYKDFWMYNNSVAAPQNILQVGTTADLPTIMSIGMKWGNKDAPGHVSNTQFKIFGKLLLINSIVYARLDQLEPMINLKYETASVAGSGTVLYGGKPQIYSSILGVNVSMVNCIFDEFSLATVWSESPANIKPIIKNCMFRSTETTTPFSGTVDTANVDYNIAIDLPYSNEYGPHSLYINPILDAAYKITKGSIAVKAGVVADGISQPDKFGKFIEGRPNIGIDLGAGATTKGRARILDLSSNNSFF